MRQYDLKRRQAERTDIVDSAINFTQTDALSGIVRLQADDDVMALEPHLHAIDTIILEFTTFRDGRAFTQARTLREALKFGGQILALGAPLPDQANFLQRCGFNAVLLRDDTQVAQWVSHETHFPLSYQDKIFSSDVQQD